MRYKTWAKFFGYIPKTRRQPFMMVLTCSVAQIAASTVRLFSCGLFVPAWGLDVTEYWLQKRFKMNGR